MNKTKNKTTKKNNKQIITHLKKKKKERNHVNLFVFFIITIKNGAHVPYVARVKTYA